MVIPTEVSRRFFFSFAPAKESAYAVEESLFDLYGIHPLFRHFSVGIARIFAGIDLSYLATQFGASSQLAVRCLWHTPHLHLMHALITLTPYSAF